MLEPLQTDKILPCFLARLYLDQILLGTLKELGVNLGKLLANQNLARQSWLFIQDTSKILGNIFSMAEEMVLTIYIMLMQGCKIRR